MNIQYVLFEPQEDILNIHCNMSSCSSNADMETPMPVVNGIVNNALFHSSPHIHQMLHLIIHILYFNSSRLIPELCPRFCSQLD